MEDVRRMLRSYYRSMGREAGRASAVSSAGA